MTAPTPSLGLSARLLKSAEIVEAWDRFELGMPAPRESMQYAELAKQLREASAALTPSKPTLGEGETARLADDAAYGKGAIQAALDALRQGDASAAECVLQAGLDLIERGDEACAIERGDQPSPARNSGA